jgi:hypothetical protein
MAVVPRFSNRQDCPYENKKYAVHLVPIHATREYGPLESMCEGRDFSASSFGPRGSRTALVRCDVWQDPNRRDVTAIPLKPSIRNDV